MGKETSTNLDLLNSSNYDERQLDTEKERTHVSISSGNKAAREYLCGYEDCGKSFSTKGNLKAHLSLHRDEKPFVCRINGCNKRYINECRLKVHERTHNSDNKPYDCHICSKKFNEKGNLKTHMRIHTGERPFKCDKCKASFKASGHLKDHMKIHLDIKPYECSICNKKYARSCTLKIHQRTHTGEKPFKCKFEGCGKYFSEKGNMKSHYNKHVAKLNKNFAAPSTKVNSLKSPETFKKNSRDDPCSPCGSLNFFKATSSSSLNMAETRDNSPSTDRFMAFGEDIASQIPIRNLYNSDFKNLYDINVTMPICSNDIDINEREFGAINNLNFNIGNFNLTFSNNCMYKNTELELEEGHIGDDFRLFYN